LLPARRSRQSARVISARTLSVFRSAKGTKEIPHNARQQHSQNEQMDDGPAGSGNMMPTTQNLMVGIMSMHKSSGTQNTQFIAMKYVQVLRSRAGSISELFAGVVDFHD
jgi:hypothetical protein